jgi:hypothetical protein
VDCWELIAEAKAEAARTSAWPSGMQVATVLVKLLHNNVRHDRLRRAELLAFDHWLHRQAHRADIWELCAASYLISGYLSEDGFQDFRYGLIALGRRDFEETLAFPDDVLADLPVVQAIAAGHASPFTLHGEQLQSAAAEAYGEGYWDDRLQEPLEKATTTWTGAQEIPTRMPKLYALFPRPLTADADEIQLSRS